MLLVFVGIVVVGIVGVVEVELEFVGIVGVVVGIVGVVELERPQQCTRVDRHRCCCCRRRTLPPARRYPPYSCPF